MTRLTNARIYRHWLFERRNQNVPWPDYQDVFERGRVTCILPYLRVLWSDAGSKHPPEWESATWSALIDPDSKQVQGSFVRYFRSDQILDWLNSIHSYAESPEGFSESVVKLLLHWLVPVSEPLLSKREVLDRRLETIRVAPSDDGLRWSRRSQYFPDSLRAEERGLDSTHTPESERSGLTRYICIGWAINDSGQLESREGARSWGPSNVVIQRILSNSPRRSMLGASLQTRAVPLDFTDIPIDTPADAAWTPPGRNLRIAFSSLSGLTHEDAFVVSQSAAEKLSRSDSIDVRVLVPAVAGFVTSSVVPEFQGNSLELEDPVCVKRGTTLLHAFIDLYALQWRRHEADAINATDGWLEVEMPAAVAQFDGELVAIRTRILRSRRWRLAVRFCFARKNLGVGSKLSTQHGLKGVVAQVLSDTSMPVTEDGRAEVVISQFGIIRRGAMGQVLEASGGVCQEELPRMGSAFIMRQPQDPEASLRVTGPRGSGGRGQRYGQMEFWALMAHGAPEIATELLSLNRSTARWIYAESQLQPEAGHRGLARTALNRYLKVLGSKLSDGRCTGSPSGKLSLTVHVDGEAATLAVDVNRPTREIESVLTNLDNEEWFRDHGGMYGLDLRSRPLHARFDVPGHGEVNVSCEAFYILPPWLRPEGEHWHHPLTIAYRTFLRRLRCAWYDKTDEHWAQLNRALRECLRFAFDDKYGMPQFLRREVLGRRLTRSARAVIVPDPSLRLDQIRIPAGVYEELLADLGEPSAKLVLVHRNPTLHRRSLLALRPVIDNSDVPVFGMPLGILAGMGADFDGDQVSAIALETTSALSAAERLLPGAKGLRVDRFRCNCSAFPLLNELADPGDEYMIAAGHNDLDQTAWAVVHADAQRNRLTRLGNGWDLINNSTHWQEKLASVAALWHGSISEVDWLAQAGKDMASVYLGVRRKGQYGGILRRQAYRVDYTNPNDFFHSIDALGAITERIVQKALSVKQGDVTVSLKAVEQFFAKPTSEFLHLIDDSLDSSELLLCLQHMREPEGALALLARPSLETVLSLAFDQKQCKVADHDPRLSWFL